MCVFGRWLLPEGTASAQPFDTTIVQRLQNFGTFSRTKKVGGLPACIHWEQQQQILLTICVFIKFALLVACPFDAPPVRCIRPVCCCCSHIQAVPILIALAHTGLLLSCCTTYATHAGHA